MIFVTGGTGMVGAHLLFDLACRGMKVRALRRPGSNIKKVEKIFGFYRAEYQPLLQNIEWVDGDILDKEELCVLLDGVDEIYHAAAMLSFNSGDRELMIHNNRTGTSNMVDLALALHIPKFCHVSSISAIGPSTDGIEANEEHFWHNSHLYSAYAESKYLSEMEVWRAIFQGLNAVIVNPSVIIGPGDWKSGSSMFFPVVWKGLKYYTRGVTGFVDVRDVTKAMQSLMEEKNWDIVKNQRYIISAANIPFHDFFNKIADALQRNRPKFLVGKTLLKLAWRFSLIKSLITGTRPYITRDTAQSAGSLCFYDGSKICRTIGFNYTPIEVSIRDNSLLFQKEFESG